MKKSSAASYVSNGVCIIAEPLFLEEQSDAERDFYAWGYRIRIENRRKEAIRVLERRWVISNSLGITQEVGGHGIIGELPIIECDDIFEYTSGIHLGTPSGVMFGWLTVAISPTEFFELAVPPLSLDSPYDLRVKN